MANFWHDLAKWIEDASNVVGREAGDLTLKGRLKLEIFELTRKLREDYVGLGTIVFEEVFIKKNEKWQQSKKIKGIVKKIKGKKTMLKKKETEYKKVGKTTKKR